MIPDCTDPEAKRTNGNTTTMQKHIIGKHRWEYHYCIVEGMPLAEAIKLAKRHYEEEANARNGLALEACGNTVFREKMVRLVVCENVPFRLLDAQAFREIMAAMRPDVSSTFVFHL